VYTFIILWCEHSNKRALLPVKSDRNVKFVEINPRFRLFFVEDHNSKSTFLCVCHAISNTKNLHIHTESWLHCTSSNRLLVQISGSNVFWNLYSSILRCPCLCKPEYKYAHKGKSNILCILTSCNGHCHWYNVKKLKLSHYMPQRRLEGEEV
jgi:hypothetical protein